MDNYYHKTATRVLCRCSTQYDTPIEFYIKDAFGWKEKLIRNTKSPLVTVYLSDRVEPPQTPCIFLRYMHIKRSKNSCEMSQSPLCFSHLKEPSVR